MFSCRPYCLVFGALIAVVLCAAPVAADDPCDCPPRPQPHQKETPTAHNSVNRNSAVPPGHQRYYVYNVGEYPWFTHGFAVPTYNWGYFGAHSRPIFSAQHRDYFYYQNNWQWTFRPSD